MNDLLTMEKTWTPERIRALRKAMGLTQAELASRLGYRRSRTITEFENGTATPTVQAGIILDMLAAATAGFEEEE